MKNYVRLGEKQYNLKFHFMEAQYDHPNGGKTWYNKPLDVKEIGAILYDEELTKDALEFFRKIWTTTCLTAWIVMIDFLSLSKFVN